VLGGYWFFKEVLGFALLPFEPLLNFVLDGGLLFTRKHSLERSTPNLISVFFIRKE